MSVAYPLSRSELEEARFFPCWAKEKIESCIKEKFGDEDKPQRDYLRAYLVEVLVERFDAEIEMGAAAAYFLDGWDAAIATCSIRK